MRKELIISLANSSNFAGMKDFRGVKVTKATSARTCDFLHNTSGIRAYRYFQRFTATLELQSNGPNGHPFKVPEASPIKIQGPRQ